MPQPRSPIEIMIDQACGLGPSDVDKILAEKEENRTQAIVDLANAAIAWWDSHCKNYGLKWSRKKHMENPHINCFTGPQRLLCDAVVKLLKNGW